MKRITMLSFEVATDTETTAFAEESDSDTAESAAEETESSGYWSIILQPAAQNEQPMRLQRQPAATCLQLSQLSPILPMI